MNLPKTKVSLGSCNEIMGERHQEHKQECEMMECGIQAKEDKSSRGGVAVKWKNKLDGNDKNKRLWVIEGLSGFKIVCVCWYRDGMGVAFGGKNGENQISCIFHLPKQLQQQIMP